jgi:sodium transport system ATP-binding protein
VIKSEGLRKVYHPSRGGPIVAVCDAHFSVADGEVFGLLGPNGAGKTTLLRMLATILTPTSGTCWIDGISAVDDPAAIRRRIGFLSGNTKLYGRLTAREVLQYFGRLHGMDDALIRDRTQELARNLDNQEFINRRCDTLSTGQTQKVSIARCLLHNPPVLILDEPTLGLDIMTSRTILNFILEARGQGHSIIFSTHYMTEAELLCDRVGLIYKGDLLAVDTKAALYEQTHTHNLQDAFLALVEGEIHPPDAAAHH